MTNGRIPQHTKRYRFARAFGRRKAEEKEKTLYPRQYPHRRRRHAPRVFRPDSDGSDTHPRERAYDRHAVGGKDVRRHSSYRAGLRNNERRASRGLYRDRHVSLIRDEAGQDGQRRDDFRNKREGNGRNGRVRHKLRVRRAGSPTRKPYDIQRKRREDIRRYAAYRADTDLSDYRRADKRSCDNGTRAVRVDNGRGQCAQYLCRRGDGLGERAGRDRLL